MAMVTHSMRDLLALPREEDRQKAAGFVERAGMVICAGLPRDEMPRLQQVVNVSKVEQQRLTEWSTPPGWDTTDNTVDPPGRGNFLIKVGSRPGITMHVDLTQAELAVNDTNKRWHQKTSG